MLLTLSRRLNWSVSKLRRVRGGLRVVLIVYEETQASRTCRLTEEEPRLKVMAIGTGIRIHLRVVLLPCAPSPRARPLVRETSASTRAQRCMRSSYLSPCHRLHGFPFLPRMGIIQHSKLSAVQRLLLKVAIKY